MWGLPLQRTADYFDLRTGAYEALARQHGVRYLNLQHDPRLVAADFEDSDHLNADGAARFSKLLDADLRSPVETRRAERPEQAKTAAWDPGQGG